jgi:raffinose/stachyose/melibiose transport system substrate-binding protein
MPVLERDFVEEEGVFTHPGYRRGLEILQQLVTYMGPTATSVDHETTRNMFAAEETVPIAQQLPIVYLQLSECGNLQRDNPNMDYGMFNFPAIEGGEGDPTYMTGAPEGFMMSNTSKVPEAAERFYKFLYSQFAMDEYIKIEKSPVGVRGMITPENSYPKLLEVENVIMNVKAFPWFDNAINIQIADVFMRGSQSIAAGEKSYDTVMGEVHTAAASVRAAAGK